MTRAPSVSAHPTECSCQEHPELSIIVPANNEEIYLAECLGALMKSESLDGHVQILVIANACTDRTVEVARSFEAAAVRAGWAMQVIDLDAPGKLSALNVGDDLATGDLRLYLDADVLVSPNLVREVFAELTVTSAPRYVSGKPRVSQAKSSLTRAYARFWQMLPFVRSEAPGFGLYAVNAAGRRRWKRFPDIISDDTYVRLLFKPCERVGVQATYEWPMAEGFSRLVKTRRRQDQGVREVAQLFPELLSNQESSAPHFSELLFLTLKAPWGFIVYSLVTLAVRSKRASKEWTRGR